jgi:hypothetical protein
MNERKKEVSLLFYMNSYYFRFASSTHRSLLDQFSTIQHAKDVFERTSLKFPQIRNALLKIRSRVSFNRWILYGVIALCTFLLLWFVLT